MADVVRIALVGDFDQTVTAHRAIPEAAAACRPRVWVWKWLPEWVHTTTIGSTADEVAEHAGIWCVPASPYASMAAALAAIRFARESQRPFLGTCGGFQHAVLEYIRNALGHAAADHTETAPDAAMPIIARLSCSLVEKAGGVFFREGSRLQSIYGGNSAEEEYRCNYGVNPEYAELLAGPAGRAAGCGDRRLRRGGAGGGIGRPPVLPIATLFQPERLGLRRGRAPVSQRLPGLAAVAGRKRRES